MSIPDFLIWHCAGCGAPAVGKKKPCDCATNIGVRDGPNGSREQTWWDAPLDEKRDLLLMKCRCLALRMQGRVKAIEDRDGKDGAVTGIGVGIGYLLARDLAKALSEVADFIEGGGTPGGLGRESASSAEMAQSQDNKPSTPFDYRCDCCDNGLSAEWDFCPWCGKIQREEPSGLCLAGITANKACRPDDTLKRCTICGFVVDTQYATEKPTTHLRPRKRS